MTTTEVEPLEGETLFPAEIFDETQLALPAGMEFEQWERLGENLQRLATSHQWWVGDWLNYGEEWFGEEHAQAIGMAGVEHKTLRNWQWVARRVPAELRNPELSWSHHRIVADLDNPADIRDVLKRADHEGWTTRELAQAVGGMKSAPELEPAEPPIAEPSSTITFTMSFTLDREDESGGRRVLDFLVETMEAELSERHLVPTKTSRSPS